METKDFPVEIKADAKSGTFEALVSVFNNVDLVGDRILPGAFTKTIRDWRSKGDPVPVILSHQWDDPFALIGSARPTDMKQTPEGLVVKGNLDLENPTAAQVHKLMKQGVLKAFSFGYTVPEGGQKMADDGANEVTEVDLVEVGPTLKGANPEAGLRAVKSALAETTETTRTLSDELRELAALAEKGDDDAAWKALAALLESKLEPPADTKTSDQMSDEPVAVEDASDEEPKAKSTAQDPLRRRGEELAFRIGTEGVDLSKSPEVKPPPSPEPQLSVRDLRQRSHDLMLNLLVEVE